MTRLNIEQLRTFLEVVRLGGMRRAAQSLNITQPAVSARIKALEDTLAVPLFERSEGHLTLTKRGDMLVRYAEQFEILTEQVTADIMSPEGIERQLRLGVAETVAQSWLPDFVTGLHRQFKKVEIEIDVDVSTNLRQRLLDREIDLAILLGPVSEATVSNIALPGFTLAWYVSNTVPDAPEAQAELIARHPVITYARGTRPNREMRRALYERLGPGTQIFSSSSLSACFRLVEAGLGVAALPEILGRDWVSRGQLRRFDPGWCPAPLQFTASYLGDPKSHVVETAAQLAHSTALRHTDQNILS
ncbi:LysR family transcriptional regulator (plasmid) [Sulfitobacter alexandrii]|uniref:LysR family transcriptional regulator n=1 Tax=Sulfitobacter alexandrii TaxID=1917485 RepID=A0A1J0WMU3_9RHOB|nr:LysR family transcriptional regulator [Sulfitobacter alexandrii]APE45655.1 LysR family transcriptional regulator [Sulfitobacter alexandrii]